MNYRYLFPGMADYPPGIGQTWRSDPLPVLTVAGDSALLRSPLVGLLSSSEVPPDLTLPSFDMAVRLRDTAVPVAGGFQGEVEGWCLKVLLGGNIALLVCPARSLDGLRISPRLEERFAAGRLMYVSAERPTCRRPTSQAAMRRNDLLAGLAERLIVLCAPPGSRALRSAAEFLERGGPVACFDHRRNRDLLLLGAFPIPPDGPALRPRSLRVPSGFPARPDPVELFLCGAQPPTAGPAKAVDAPEPGTGGDARRESVPHDPLATPVARAGSLSRASRASR